MIQKGNFLMFRFKKTYCFILIVSTYPSHESLIKSAKLLGFRYKRDFVFQWRDLSEHTRIAIYEFNDFLKKNGYNPRTTIKYFLIPIALIQKLQGEKDLINYLDISKQSLSQLTKIEFNTYLKNSISFLENQRPICVSIRLSSNPRQQFCFKVYPFARNL